MPQKAPMGIFIINAQLEGRQQLHDRLDHPIRPFILDQAMLHRHYPMGTRRIHAGDRHSPLVHREHRVNLVAVMKGVLHA